jgi:hypothetical protein
MLQLEETKNGSRREIPMKPRLLPRLVAWGGPHVRLHVGSITSVVAPYADILCEERSDGTEHEQQREVAFIAFSF